MCGSLVPVRRILRQPDPAPVGEGSLQDSLVLQQEMRAANSIMSVATNICGLIAVAEVVARTPRQQFSLQIQLPLCPDNLQRFPTRAQTALLHPLIKVLVHSRQSRAAPGR
jgi:hypothetical protein